MNPPALPAALDPSREPCCFPGRAGLRFLTGRSLGTQLSLRGIAQSAKSGAHPRRRHIIWFTHRRSMAKLLTLRIGVADDPTALQPTLNDCREAMLPQTDLLVHDVITGLVAATAPNSQKRIAGFQQAGRKAAIMQLSNDSKAVAASYREELTKLVYEGGGKETVATEVLRFEDLRLFEDSELDQSIEVARAQQEVTVAVDDVLPTLAALVSTQLGWRTIQPGLNPIRPDVFVRALQATLSIHVPDTQMREVLIAPAAGLLGANLRRLYKELADWLAPADRHR